jgi:hypothetical protein
LVANASDAAVSASRAIFAIVSAACVAAALEGPKPVHGWANIAFSSGACCGAIAVIAALIGAMQARNSLTPGMLGSALTIAMQFSLARR